MPAERPAEPPMPTVSAIVVSYNTRDMTLRCLAALRDDLGDGPSEVWLVDNASGDGTVGAVRAAFPDVRVIAGDRNLGFGGANNLALARARGEFLLLLNTDAFVRPGAVAAMVAALRRRPDAAVVGPRLLNADGSLQRSCYRFPSPARAWLENLWLADALRRHPRAGDYRWWPHDEPRDVDFVVGACMMVRRAAYERVGGFDERFFMYAEETDWQRRLRDGGWAVAFDPAAEVVHLGGGSGPQWDGRLRGTFFDSLDHYQLKHHGAAGLASVRLAMAVGCALRAALWTCVLALGPDGRLALARAKVRHHLSLVARQLTRWPRPSPPSTVL